MSATAGVMRQLVAGLLPGAVVSWEAEGGGVSVRVSDDGEPLCTAYFPADASARDAVMHVGSVVQDAAIERLGRAVPECPGHEHPAVLRTTGDGVAWTCPESARLLTAYALP